MTTTKYGQARMESLELNKVFRALQDSGIVPYQRHAVPNNVSGRLKDGEFVAIADTPRREKTCLSK